MLKPLTLARSVPFVAFWLKRNGPTAFPNDAMASLNIETHKNLGERCAMRLAAYTARARRPNRCAQSQRPKGDVPWQERAPQAAFRTSRSRTPGETRE